MKSSDDFSSRQKVSSYLYLVRKHEKEILKNIEIKIFLEKVTVFKRNKMTFSSLRLDIPNLGGHFERTIPLPLRSLVSTTLYESFASELDALVVLKRKNIISRTCLLIIIECLIGIAPFLAGSFFMSIDQVGVSSFLFFAVPFILFALTPRLWAAIYSSVDRQFSDKIKHVCEDYSRRFDTITVHYKENVCYDQDSDGDIQSHTKFCIEILYSNDFVPTAEATPVLVEAAFVVPSSPMEADIAFSKTKKEEDISKV